MQPCSGCLAVGIRWDKFQRRVFFFQASDPFDGDHVVWWNSGTVPKNKFVLPLECETINRARYPDWVKLVRLCWEGTKVGMLNKV